MTATSLHHARIAITLLASATLASAAEAPRILADKEFFTKGNFIAYAGPWSVDLPNGPKLTQGIDFADEITVHPETFPAHSELNWHWPLTPSKTTGVYGYNALSYGSYYGGIPETPITPRQIKDITTLSETFRFTMAHPIGEFNVLTEFFLGDKSGEKKTNEVGFFLHIARSAIPFVESGEQLGTFKDPTGCDWKAVQQTGPQGPYFMFVPTEDVLTGSVDFKAALDFLREQKKITGEEWFHGLAFGVEPVMGSGSMKIESLAVSYK